MVETTLFVADDATCAELFLAVRRPLAQPITRVGFNPLTRQVLGGASWDPGDGEAAFADEVPPSVRNDPASVPSLFAETPASARAPLLPLVSEEDRAHEAAVAPRLRALPHVAGGSVGGFELEELAAVLLGAAAPPARIVEAHASDGFVASLSTSATTALARLEDDALGGVLARWNARLAASRRKVDVRTLMALRLLAREAVANGGHVFVHTPRG